MILKSTIRTLALIISFLAVLTCFASCNEQQPQFVPPPFDEGAVVGTPDIETPEAVGYKELDAKGYKVAVCGKVTLTGDSADVYLTNPESNEVWFKLRILDEKGNILGETGLIRPGEYVKTITFDKKVPKVGDKITMKIMGYEPDTYYSAGVVNLNTMVF